MESNNRKPWLRCPYCEGNLAREKDEFSLLDSLGIGCFTEIALFAVTVTLMGIVWILRQPIYWQ